ncbi:hypothetical protein ANACOL_00412 [Anaerotruncus colihominis DSM 17241]|uniref:Uncharacterized protein n=1 Tax=Anaerotruncus colihominis DSM 17241 TaxID=445972 RepID=B0P6N3_9FIRM|nr:hypothetical protein ANACOL_00412 [Anaerotruncus colihominis DSM 17241]
MFLRSTVIIFSNAFRFRFHCIFESFDFQEIFYKKDTVDDNFIALSKLNTLNLVIMSIYLEIIVSKSFEMGYIWKGNLHNVGYGF